MWQSEIENPKSKKRGGASRPIPGNHGSRLRGNTAITLLGRTARGEIHSPEFERDNMPARELARAVR
jgi:hypothetical protein